MLISLCDKIWKVAQIICFILGVLIIFIARNENMNLIVFKFKIRSGKNSILSCSFYFKLIFNIVGNANRTERKSGSSNTLLKICADILYTL